MYGSSFWIETDTPRDFSSRPMEATVMPLPQGGHHPARHEDVLGCHPVSSRRRGERPLPPEQRLYCENERSTVGPRSYLAHGAARGAATVSAAIAGPAGNGVYCRA